MLSGIISASIRLDHMTDFLSISSLTHCGAWADLNVKVRGRWGRIIERIEAGIV